MKLLKEMIKFVKRKIFPEGTLRRKIIIFFYKIIIIFINVIKSIKDNVVNKLILIKISLENKYKPDNPKFSIIIPIYNRTWELKEAIDSVLSQTFQNFELMLICDGSPRETVDIVNFYKSNPHVKIFKFEDNSGNACRGRNKGIEISKGEIISFLDSDDICFPDRLKLSLYYIYKKKIDLVYGAVKIIADGTRKIDGIENGTIFKPGNLNFDELKKINPMFTCTVSVKKKCLEKYGKFRREMIYREDHELWLRLVYRGCKILGVPDLFSFYRIHSGNAELLFIDKDEKWRELMLYYYDKEYY